MSNASSPQLLSAEWWRAGPLVPSAMGALLLLLLWRVSVLERQVQDLGVKVTALQVQVTRLAPNTGR